MWEGLSDVRDWAAGIVRATAQPPEWVPIPADRASPPLDGGRLIPNGDYFQVRVLGTHLTYQREWFETYAPVLLVATEFSYDGENVTKPALIGPNMIEQLGRAAPLSTTISGTVVAGPHPLRGDTVTITVALYRVVKANIGAQFIDVVQGAAAVLDLAAGLAPYTALAKVVVSGVSAVTGGEKPLIARRDQFTKVTPGHFALIAPGANVVPENLYVKDGRLLEQVNGQWTDFRRADHVLYSIERVAAADIDVTQLALNRQWLAILDEANRSSTDDIWLSAKTKLSALVSQALTSPDLTFEHAEALEQEWTEKVKARKAKALARAAMGEHEGDSDVARGHALAILDL